MDKPLIKDLNLSLAHIGINCSNADEAEKVSKGFCDLLGLDMKVGKSSVFAGKIIECMKQPFLGEKGHIAIRTDDIDKAIKTMECYGIQFDETTLKCDEKGNKTAIYLKNQIGGFAIHLVA